MENYICIDWFTFTYKGDDYNVIIALLGLSDIKFINTYGFYGYKDRIYSQGISIFYNGKTADMGICVEMSGQGCRTFESFGLGNWYFIFDLILSNPDAFNVTRLDIAYDDFNGILDIDVMEDYIIRRSYITKFRKCKSEREYSKSNDLFCGSTIYFGSRSSDIMFRCYDKKAEREDSDIDKWIRFEIQLRGNRSYSFLQKLKVNDSEITNLSEMFFSVIANYFRFIEKSKTDTNDRRAPLAGFWKRFVGTASAVKLFCPGADYDFKNLYHYVIHNTAGAFYTLSHLIGSDTVVGNINEYIENHRSSLNKKYAQLLDNRNLINSKEN